VSEIDDFLDGCRAAFAAASAAAPRTDSFDLSFAGHPMTLDYASPDLLARVRPTIEHLEVDAPLGAPELSIRCWDRVATGVAPPPPPWSMDDFLARSRIRGYVDGPVRVSFDAMARVLNLLDREGGEAFVYAADVSVIPHYFDRAPFHPILSWWTADHGIALLHASAVADDTGAVVIAGASGAGKSTTALTCLSAGLRILGDDACAVRLDPEPTAYSVYSRAKLEPDALARVPSLAPLIVACNEGQTLIDPGDRHVAQAPLRAVLLPRITGEPASKVVPVSERDAVHALLASVVHQGVGLVDGTLAALTGLARRVPCLRFELGSDLDGVVAVVRDVLQQASPA
jgi:hypothetical protein